MVSQAELPMLNAPVFRSESSASRSQHSQRLGRKSAEAIDPWRLVPRAKLNALSSRKDNWICCGAKRLVQSTNMWNKNHSRKTNEYVKDRHRKCERRRKKERKKKKWTQSDESCIWPRGVTHLASHPARCVRECACSHTLPNEQNDAVEKRETCMLWGRHIKISMFFFNLGTFGSFSSASAPIFATICKKQNLHMIFATWCKWVYDIFQHFLRSSSTKLSCRFLKILKKLLTFKLAYLCQNLLFFWNCFKIAKF